MNTKRESRPEAPAVGNHRLYALPERPWSVSEICRDLLFAHWPIPSQEIARLLPYGLEVDTFDKSAWVGVVPFWLDRVKLGGMPRIPAASRFPELNLRTYVRERNTNRTGVYFLSLEASNPMAVTMARMILHLPYHWARISVRPRSEREFTYRSERLLSSKSVRFRAHYRGLGRLRMLEQSWPGTIEYFLTERYCFFTEGRRGQLLRGEIQHEPWPLEAAEAEIELNDLPAACGIKLPDTPPLLYYSRELAVYIWSPEVASLSPMKALEAAGVRPAEI